MSPSINDLGLGYCAKCKSWKELPCLHPEDSRKPRKARRRICAACYAKIKRKIDPLYFVTRAISAHKSMAKESDYNLTDIKELHKWQAFQCPYCGDFIHYSFTLEHIVPREQGGRNILLNMLLVCNSCNSSKQNNELLQWLEKKNYKVRPKILTKIKGAYDEHGFNFKASCEHCTGSKTACSTCGSKSHTKV